MSLQDLWNGGSNGGMLKAVIVALLIAAVTSAWEAKGEFAELTATVAALRSDVAAMDGRIGELRERVRNLEAANAYRDGRDQSGDDG